MAQIRWYLNNSLLDGWQLVDQSAAAAATCNCGWVVGTGATFSSELQANTERASTTFVANTVPDGTLDTTLKDAFRSQFSQNGAFDAGNWTFQFAVVSTVQSGAADGQIVFRVLKANADGSSATEITSAQQATTIATNVAGTDVNITATWAAPAWTITNQYLFVQVAWKRTGAGGMTTTNIRLRTGSSATVGTTGLTANFIPGNQAVSGVHNASTATINVPTIVNAPDYFSVDAVQIPSTAGAMPPAVAPGPVTVLAVTITSPSLVRVPTVAPGAVTVAAATQTTTIQVFAPTVAPGAVTITAAARATTTQMFAPTVRPDLAVTTATISSTAILRVPTLAPGPVTVLTATIPSTASVLAPTVIIPGADQSITTAIITAPFLEYLLLEDGSDVLQEDGSSRLILGGLVGTAVAFAPGVRIQFQITTGTIGAGSVLYPPGGGVGPVTIAPPQIPTTVVVFAPSLTVGPAEIHVATIGPTTQLWPVAVFDIGASLKATFMCAHLDVIAATVGMQSRAPSVAVTELMSARAATGATRTARVAVAELVSPLVVLEPARAVGVVLLATSATAVLGPTRAGEASTALAGARAVAGPTEGGAVAALAGATVDLSIKEC